MPGFDDVKVNVTTSKPIYNVLKTPIIGTIFNIRLSTNQIYTCLAGGAKVEEILNNGTKITLGINNYNKENNPAIDVELKFNDHSGVHTISWNGTTRSISNLTGISVFDSNYTNSFLEKRSADSAVVYPYGLYLFSSLSKAMDKVNQQLQSEIDIIRRNLPQINLQDMSDTVTKVITSTE